VADTKQIQKLTPAQIKAKIQKLKGDRGTFETHWQEVTDHFLTRKNTVTTTKYPGEKRTWQLLDNTGIHANEMLAGALHGMLTNPYQPWFEFTTGDTVLDNEDAERRWLQQSARQIINVLNNTNFQTEVHELYTDLPSIGTACMFTEEDERDIVRFSTKFIANYYIDENNKKMVDQVYQEWHWSANQCVEEFGIDNVSPKIKKAYETKSEEKFCIQYALYPKTVVDPKFVGNKLYTSQYVTADEGFELSVGEFMEFPAAVPRWAKAPGEMYGRGPAMTALPEMKVLNKMNETMLIGAQKIVDPPVQMPDDGFILPLITRPGGVNYRRSGNPDDLIRPIFSDTRIDFGYQAMADIRKRVRDAFYVDQLKLSQDQKYMTAQEVTQRTEESMRLLGPMLGRMQTEFLDPVLARVYRICLDRGVINPDTIPESLKKKKLTVRYSSIIAKAQRVSETQAIFRTIEAAMPFINLDPRVKDIFNGEAAARIIAGSFGAPQEMIRDVGEVQMIRKQQEALQQQMLQAQQQAAQAQQVTGSIQAASKLQEQQARAQQG
jgi:hypothetical protein